MRNSSLCKQINIMPCQKDFIPFQCNQIQAFVKFNEFKLKILAGYHVYLWDQKTCFSKNEWDQLATIQCNLWLYRTLLLYKEKIVLIAHNVQITYTYELFQILYPEKMGSLTSFSRNIFMDSELFVYVMQTAVIWVKTKYLLSDKLKQLDCSIGKQTFRRFIFRWISTKHTVGFRN